MIPSISELRRVCQPQDLDLSLYRRAVVRKMSIYFTALMLRLNVSANQVSIAKGVIGVAGGALLAFPKLWLNWLGLFLLHFEFLLDAVDGEVARYRGTHTTTGGQYIDKVGDMLARSTMFFCWAYGIWAVNGKVIFLFLGCVLTTLGPLARFCMVETLLENLHGRSSNVNNADFQRSLSQAFVGSSEVNRAEYLMSVLMHPIVNFVTLAFAVETVCVFLCPEQTFVLRAVSFLVYWALAFGNNVRKIIRYYGMANVKA